MIELIGAIANLTITAVAPLVLWVLRELRADVKGIKENDLPHLYAELKALREDAKYGK